MDEVMLTVSEAAELKGCSQRYIRRIIEDGKLSAEAIEIKGRGHASLEYRIPLTALDSKLQIKYKHSQHRQLTFDTFEADAEADPLDFESITAAEREQIRFWKGILNEWDTFRESSSLPKGEADIQFETFINAKLEATQPGVNISIKTLHRKRKALKEGGEATLIDRRGKHKNHTRKLTTEMFDIFEFYYLHKSKKTVNLCRFLTGEELRRRYGSEQELPCRATFERAAKNIPIPCVMYFREGNEAYLSKCAPYIRRIYDDLEPNDIWVADGHTFDVMVLGKDGKPFRPYLSAFMDVRTRKIIGWIVTDKLSGDATIYALKRGVEVYGAPKAIQADNGREYLFQDFSGDAGFRKKSKSKQSEFKPPTILETLGIEMRVSLPMNARAKAIERAFDTVKETFSKLFESYTGGSVAEKPDDLKEVLQQPDKLITIDKFMEYVDTYITGFYNKQPHSGEGMYGRSPDEAYAELFREKRVVPKDKLNLMFMRYSKGTMQVGPNGITLKIYGEKLQYSDPNLWREYFGRQVYVRFSPDNLSSVRVYNTANQFICEAKLDSCASYNATKEELQAITREKKAQEKTVRDYKRLKNTKSQDALDALINKASENLEIPENVNAEILRVIQSNETLPEPLQKAAGGEVMSSALVIDWSAAAKRVRNSR